MAKDIDKNIEGFPVNFQVSYKDDTYFRKARQYIERQCTLYEIKTPLIEYNTENRTIGFAYDLQSCRAFFGQVVMGEYGTKNVEIFVKECATEGFKQRQQGLLDRTNDFYKNLPTPEKQSVPITSETSEKELIGSILGDTAQEKPGSIIYIGECHSDITPKMFIVENLKDFKQRGVTTLYMEHLTPQSMTFINEYLQSPANSQMPEALTNFLHSLDKSIMHYDTGQGGKYTDQYTFTGIIKAAKEMELSIVPLDTAESHAIIPDSTEKDNRELRYMTMNYVAHHAIKPENGKGIVLIGSGHVNTDRGIRGVAELGNGVGVVISDAKSEEHEGIKASELIMEGETAIADVKLSLHPSTAYERYKNGKKYAPPTKEELLQKHQDEAVEKIAGDINELYENLAGTFKSQLKDKYPEKEQRQLMANELALEGIEALHNGTIEQYLKKIAEHPDLPDGSGLALEIKDEFNKIQEGLGIIPSERHQECFAKVILPDKIQKLVNESPEVKATISHIQELMKSIKSPDTLQSPLTNENGKKQTHSR